MDKSSWGEGPWQTEPDEARWTDAATKLTCLIVRSELTGSFNGYVGVPAGHALYRREGGPIDRVIDVHGGVTYYGELDGELCLWWLGFDTAHWDDFPPALAARVRAQGYEFHFDGTYKDVAFMEQECTRLAEQIWWIDADKLAAAGTYPLPKTANVPVAVTMGPPTRKQLTVLEWRCDLLVWWFAPGEALCFDPDRRLWRRVERGPWQPGVIAFGHHSL